MADTQAPLLRRSAPEAPGAASRTSGVRAHRFFFFDDRSPPSRGGPHASDTSHSSPPHLFAFSLEEWPKTVQS